MTALLMLSGCGAEPEPTAAVTDPTQATVAPTTAPIIQPTGYYDPDSALESSTGGAVKVYPLNRSDSYGLVAVGEDLLLLSGMEVTTLTRLTGSTLYVSAAANLDCYIDTASAAFQASEKGVTYYDDARNQLVFLDSGLKEVSRVDLPEQIIGSPALSADRKHLYYCTASQLRCLDLETGLDKLLKEMFFPQQALTALHCDDTVLECSVVDDYGNQYGLYISAETGGTVWETIDDDVTLWTWGEYYFASHYDGAYQELLTGFALQEPMMLLGDYGAITYPILGMTAAVQISAGTDSTTLSCFDLETGLRDYALELPGADLPTHILGNTAESCIWFLRYGEDYRSDVICRWDYTQSPTADETDYLTRRYSLEAPDTDALARCQESAAEIAKKHGVEILLWTDATAYQPEGYTLSPEYQIPLIADSLERLDAALAQYPAKMLKKAASGTSGGKIRICLVRQITGDTSRGLPERNSALQFWDEDENTYAAVTLGDSMEGNLHHALFHCLESRIISTCNLYDDWNSLNPEGFSYTLHYIIQPQDADQLLRGRNRAFIDLFSMTFPREDRATIMEYAMTPGNEDLFESEIMQAKLSRLCQGIRKAFSLQKSEETFLWEQYLK